MSKPEEVAAVFVDIQTIHPHPDNPRMNQDAIDSVADSIRKFKFGSPIVARQEDRVIIAGHTRYAASLKLGLEKVPVRFLDLDPVDAKLLMIADNKLGEKAQWDFMKMKDIFAEIKDISDDDIQAIGFSVEEFNGILESDFNFDFNETNPEDNWNDDSTDPDYDDDDETRLRVIQLYYPKDQFIQVSEMLSDLATHYGTDNHTDTVSGVVQTLHAHLKL